MEKIDAKAETLYRHVKPHDNQVDRRVSPDERLKMSEG